MKSANIDVFFHMHPVFRHEEFAAWKTKESVLKAVSINMALQYYVKKGRIMRIHRMLFAVIPPGESSDAVSIDPYLVAAKAAPDSVLAYHTALELHGVAYSTFGRFNYLTGRKNKPFEFQNQRFQPSKQPSTLKRTKQTSVSTQTINRQGVDIQVTNLARTYVDVLDRIELSGGWEEVCRAVNNMVSIDVSEIIHYAGRINNARLAAKVGYFLEQRKGAFQVSDEQLADLLLASPKVPQYASKRDSNKFELIKKWNILLPEFVIHRSWEEPNEDV